MSLAYKQCWCLRLCVMDRDELAKALDTVGMSWEDVASVFEAAAERVEHAWCQENYSALSWSSIEHERRIACCAAGAINTSVTGLWFDGTEHAAVAHDYTVVRKGQFVRAIFARWLVLSGALPGEWDVFGVANDQDKHIAAIAAFNDAPGQTVAGVAAALRACAQVVRGA